MRRRRRLALAAVLLAAAGLAALRGPAHTEAVVLAGDRPAGHVLVAADLVVATRDPAELPTGVVVTTSAALGHRLTGAARAGELLTDARVSRDLDPSGRPDSRVVPVPLADPLLATVVHPGDRVDVLADEPVPSAAEPVGPAGPAGPAPPVLPASASATGRPSRPTVLAADAEVVEVPTAPTGSSRVAGSGAILVRLPSADAAVVATRASAGPLALSLHG